jgi:hypothetical protein
VVFIFMITYLITFDRDTSKIFQWWLTCDNKL